MADGEIRWRLNVNKEEGEEEREGECRIHSKYTPTFK